MAGQWLMTTQRSTLGNTTSQQTVTIELPRSNFLSRIHGRISVTTALGMAGTIAVDRIRVIANGSAVLWDTEGGQARSIQKFESGSNPTNNGVSGTSPIFDFILAFGRFPRDEDVLIPAKLFKSLQLQLLVTTSQAGANYVVDVASEEWVSNDPVTSKRMKKVALIGGTTSVAANAVLRQRLPLGNILRAIYIHTDDVDNVDGGPIRILINNGAEIPVSIRYEALRELNVHTYRFDDAAIPAPATGEELTKLDFDVLENLANVVDSSVANEIVVETTADTAGTSGDVAFITEEIIPVA